MAKFKLKDWGNYYQVKADLSSIRFLNETCKTNSSNYCITNRLIYIVDDRLTEKNYRKSLDLYPDGTHVYVKSFSDGTNENKEQHLKRLLNFFIDNVNILDTELYIVAHGGLVNRIFEATAVESNRLVDKYKIGYCSIFSFKYNKITKSFQYLNHFELDSVNSNY